MSICQKVPRVRKLFCHLYILLITINTSELDIMWISMKIKFQQPLVILLEIINYNSCTMVSHQIELTKEVCFTGKWRPLYYSLHIRIPITDRRSYHLAPFFLLPFIIQHGYHNVFLCLFSSKKPVADAATKKKWKVEAVVAWCCAVCAPRVTAKGSLGMGAYKVTDLGSAPRGWGQVKIAPLWGTCAWVFECMQAMHSTSLLSSSFLIQFSIIFLISKFHSESLFYYYFLSIKIKH